VTQLSTDEALIIIVIILAHGLEQLQKRVTCRKAYWVLKDFLPAPQSSTFIISSKPTVVFPLGCGL
jgi:hypothetical protein